MNNKKQFKKDVNVVLWILRLMYGITFIGAGLDKFFGYVTDWHLYINPQISEMTGIAASMFVKVSGIIEIILGLLVFTNYAGIAAIAMSAVLFAYGIALGLFAMYLDTAARYIALGLGAIVLYYVTRIKQVLENS